MGIDSLILLDIEIRNVLNSYFYEPYDGGDNYNFACNVCGDSKTDKHKKRGFILKNQNPWMFYCHNCGASMPVIFWLREYFPDNYKSYRKQTMSGVVDPTEQKSIMTKRRQKLDPAEEKTYTKFFKNILAFPDAVSFCERRMIPKEVYSTWYYAIDGKYKKRIIIPFRNDKNKIYYYQGRILEGSILKYLSRKGDYNSIYNFYLVDRDKPVVVLEGPIDSIFVENSVAVTGLKLKDEKLNNFPYKYYLLDNDKSGFKKSIKMLSQGNYVFNWTLFLKDHDCTGPVKDVNDFILKNKHGITKLTFAYIKKYFTKSQFHIIYFK